MTKTYLVIAFLITSFLVGDAYGESEVYYCTDTGNRGFAYERGLKNFKPANFPLIRFKMKLDKVSKSIELTGDKMFREKYDCHGVEFGLELTIQCHGLSLRTFVFNLSNGNFVRSGVQGHVVSNNPADINIAYGKCDKF